jgi:uncharacterized membrane protein required for colicin V production
MVSLNFFFFCFLILFCIIGAMRGWAKEMLVTFSAILALFIIAVLEAYVAPINAFALPGSAAQFWLRVVILILLAFFGYQAPKFPKMSEAKFARERLSDTLLGLFLGLLNGYLIVGTLWYFLAQANYAPIKFILAPDANTEMGRAAIQMLSLMAPMWLVTPYLYFAVGLAFIFVIVVFL